MERHLVDALLAEGHEVVALDNCASERRPTSTRRSPPAAAASSAATSRSPSTTSAGPSTTSGTWPAPPPPPDCLRLPIETTMVGAMGTRNLLDLAQRQRARFFLASTSEVYGDPEVSPQAETYWGRVNPVGPRSVYDEAKRFAEALTTAYRHKRGVETRIVPIFNTYGPRMRLDDGRVVPNLLGQALRGEPLTVYGDGSQTRSFCYVDDEVDALLRLMRSDEPGPVNVGNPREMTILELATHVQRVSGRQLPIVHKPLPQDDPRQRRPDVTKAREVLGWEPKVPLEEGLRRAYGWFRARGALDQAGSPATAPAAAQTS